MLIGWRVDFAVIGIACSTLWACGGNVAKVSGSGTGDGAATGSGGSMGADSGASAQGGSGGSPPVAPVRTDTPAERARACNLYFTALFSPRCARVARPQSELERLAPLFEGACVEEFDMPGNVNTAGALTACANALQVSNCLRQFGPPKACDIRGTLPRGAPCILGTQCQSGECLGTTPGTTPEGHLNGADTCGKCDAVAIGQPLDDPDLGQPCDTLRCRPGLHCDSVCEKDPALNDPCSPGLCAPPLVCRRIDSTGTTCQPPGSAGDDCLLVGDQACAVGLVCDSNNRCAEAVWVGPGEACDTTHHCLVGECSRTRPLTGTCPTTAADGEPCSSDEDCDTLSHCVNQSAPRGVTTGVCGSMSRVVCGG